MMNKKLVRFLNDEENYRMLSESKINNDELFDKSLDQKFSRKLLLSGDLSDEAYKGLINSVYWLYHDLDVSELPENRISILLDTKKIRFSIKNFNFLIDSGTDKYINLIESDFDAFYEKKDELELPEGTITKLIQSSAINTQDKQKIITGIYEESSFDLFDSEEGLVREIVDFCRRNQIELRSEIIERLFQHEEDRNRKIELLIIYAPSLNKDQVYLLLSALGNPYSTIKPKGVFAYLPKGELNRKLAIALDASGYVSSYSTTLRKIKLALIRK